jgi:hypothetical protein
MPANAAPFPLLRAGIAAGIVLALSGGAHVAAGGVLPVPLLLAALTAFTVMSTVVLSRIRSTLPLMISVLAASQYVLHWAFNLLSAAGPGPEPDTWTRLVRHEQSTGHHLLTASMQPPLSPTSGWPVTASMTDGAMPLGAGSGMHEGMVWWHGAATLAAALLLAHGEAALWALAGWLRPLLHLPRTARVDDVVGPACSYPTVGRPLRRLLHRPATLRGPPTAAAVPT